MYLYDLHCHTLHGSKCGHVTAREHLHYYKKLGFAGFCITDHFSGNSTLEEEVCWEDRVNLTFDVCNSIKDEADELGIKVFPAMEFSMRADKEKFLPATGNDFIILGLEREWMLENREVFFLDFSSMCKKLREAGAFIIHAHPFLEGSWIANIVLCPRDVDAVEIYNGHASKEVNDAAAWYAKQYGLLTTAGSDNHSIDQPYTAGVECAHRCDTIEELIAAIKDGSATPFMRAAE